MTSRLAVVLAAGKGTRMESELPKVLVEAAGRPLIDYVLDALDRAEVDRVLVVVGYRADDVRRALSGRDNIDFVEQREQLGTGHAVKVCEEHLRQHEGPVIVLTGDSPMVQPSSLKELLSLYDEARPACILGTLDKQDPSGLGRIVRDERGNFLGIVEQKDATEEQRAITEVNMSTYVFDCGPLQMALDRMTNDNKQGEYYITDCPGILKDAGHDVRALPVLKECEALSVNTVEDLVAVEAELQRMGQPT